jgi:alkyldihydroxyacetonephosphate synthase
VTGAFRALAEQASLRGRVLDHLRDVCEVLEDDVTEWGRDYWPLAVEWAAGGAMPGRAAAVLRPTTADQVADVLRICNDERVPVTAAGGRSGVCGASVPVHGGVVLDLTAMSGIVAVDDRSLIVDVRPGTFGDAFEATLRAEHGLTCGHWPQSIALSTVGGWIACRGAGQLSTRYGKMEDILVGLDAVLADGTMLRTSAAAGGAAGPDLAQLFVGSEGTLGVITHVRLRAHPLPPAERRGAWGFTSFAGGLDAVRLILRRGATPAVLRLHDATEAAIAFDTGDHHVLLALDEGDAAIVDATFAIVEAECAAAARLDDELISRWLRHRNDVSAIESLSGAGYTLDTMEVAGPWSVLPAIYDRTIAALRSVDGTLVATAHQSHAYTDGACLYFTFAATPVPDDRERYYVAAWDAAQRAALRAGASLCHHHGVGLNRARFMAEALGAGMGVLASVKRALDPNGNLNPGKLGLPDAFGDVTWPHATGRHAT